MKTRALQSGRLGQRGSAVIAALVSVFLVFALCMAFVELAHGSAQKHRHAIDLKRAVYLSEAGLAEGYAGLAIGKTGNVGTAEEPATIGDGVFWVEADQVGAGVVELRSTAMLGRGRVALGLAAQPVEISMSSLGIFSSQDFTTNPDTFIDSYDSSVGTYVEQVTNGTNDQAVFGSNGSVDLGNATELRGDAVPGPLSSVNLGIGASVTGSTEPRAAASPLPPVEVPAIVLGPLVEVHSPTPEVLPPGEYGMEALIVAGGSEVMLSGPARVVLGEFSVESHATVLIDNRGGPVDIFVTDRLTLASGSILSTLTDDPHMLTLQVSAVGVGKVTLGATSLFYGQIYAPQARVDVLPTFEIFGSLIADLIDASPGVRLHHDRNTTPSREDVLPRMWSWRVIDVPDAVASRMGDPFHLLGVDRTLLPLPADAHQDQALLLVYLDLGGVLQNYDGMENGFDWTQVSSVLSGTRDGFSFMALPGSSVASPVVPEASLSAEEQLLSDNIASSMSSADLRLEIEALSPGLSDRVRIEALNRVPPMSSRDLYYALAKNGPNKTGFPEGQGAGPLSDAVLTAAILQADFASKELSWLLEQSSPLSTAVLDAAINRDPAMMTPHINTVLGAQ